MPVGNRPLCLAAQRRIDDAALGTAGHVDPGAAAWQQNQQDAYSYRTVHRSTLRPGLAGQYAITHRAEAMIRNAQQNLDEHRNA